MKKEPVIWKKNYTYARHMKLRDIQLLLLFLSPFRPVSCEGDQLFTFKLFCLLLKTLCPIEKQMNQASVNTYVYYWETLLL